MDDSAENDTNSLFMEQPAFNRDLNFPSKAFREFTDYITRNSKINIPAVKRVISYQSVSNVFLILLRILELSKNITPDSDLHTVIKLTFDRLLDIPLDKESIREIIRYADRMVGAAMLIRHKYPEYLHLVSELLWRAVEMSDREKVHQYEHFNKLSIFGQIDDIETLFILFPPELKDKTDFFRRSRGWIEEKIKKLCPDPQCLKAAS